MLGFSVDDNIYFHTRLPFGLRSATMACQRTTQAVAWIAKQEGLCVDVYIDDFYMVPTHQTAHSIHFTDSQPF
jgi:hypothetical protein